LEILPKARSGGDMVVHDLDDDFFAVGQVFAEIHLAHTAFAQQVEGLVLLEIDFGGGRQERHDRLI